MGGSAHAVRAAAPPNRILTADRRLAGGRRRSRSAAILALALLGAAVAIAVALANDFLAYPGWLAAQRADLILGPVIVGLYWWKRRPSSGFGPALVVFGFASLGLTLQGADQPLLYSVGVFWDAPFFVVTLWIILAFPTGAVRGTAERAILAATAGLVLVTRVLYLLFSEHVQGAGPIARCDRNCPANAFFVESHPRLLSAADWANYAVLAIAVATAAVLVSRFLRGSRPRRRALALGAAVGLVYTLAFAAFHTARFTGATDALVPLQWTLVGARSVIAWGFLAALLSAEIFAGRALQRFVTQSLGHPSIAEVEKSLRAALGDPQLRLGFRVPSGRLVDHEGRDLELPRPSSGRRLTEIARSGAPAAAIVHDAELEHDPELLLAASAAALLMFDKATLEAELGTAVHELRSSRARLVEAGDLERQRLERDLHDGVQQQLVALGIKVALARDLADRDPALRRRLDQLQTEIDDALDGVRQLAHELFPPLLTDGGLEPALRDAAFRSPLRVTVECEGLSGRYPIAFEAALYYCCLEALQNAAEHAGPDVDVVIRAGAVDGELRFSVHDDGCGFDPSSTPDGPGFANMRDRLGAFGGGLAIEAATGRGTLVSGRLLLAQPEPVSERNSSVAVTRRLTSASSGRSSFEKIEPM